MNRILQALLACILLMPAYTSAQPRESSSAASGSRTRSELVHKLNTIVIREINFKDANITDVIDFLVESSIELDPAPTRKGVNIILYQRPEPAREKKPAQTDPFLPDESGPDQEPNAKTQDNDGITMRLRNMPLIDIIKYTSEFSGMKYRIEDNAVVIYPGDMAMDRIITRAYFVQPAVVEVIFGNTSP